MKKYLLFLLIFNILPLKGQNYISLGYNINSNYRTLHSTNSKFNTEINEANSSEKMGLGHNGFMNLIIPVNKRNSIFTQLSYNVINYQTKKIKGEMYDANNQNKIDYYNWKGFRYKFITLGIGSVLKFKISEFSISPMLSYQRLITFIRISNYFVPEYDVTTSILDYYDKDNSKNANNISFSIIAGYTFEKLKFPQIKVSLKTEYYLLSVNKNNSIKNNLWAIGLGTSVSLNRVYSR